MPVCSLHLVSLKGNNEEFLRQLQSTTTKPLVISKVIRWIIKPTSISVQPLLTQEPLWDLLIIYPQSTNIPASLHSQIGATYSLQAGIPSSITAKFHDTNAGLLHPQSGAVLPLTGALDKPRIADSAQNLELTDELRSWIQVYDPQRTKGAVSMLNLLAFNPGMHSEYLKYGKEFAENIGKRRGGVAKIVGKVINVDNGGPNGAVSPETPVRPDDKSKEEQGWEEVALAHYPSIWHFADMAGSIDYQDVNQKHRVPSLRDTCILMTSELELPSIGSSDGKAKL